jgi:hypothetical protein
MNLYMTLTTVRYVRTKDGAERVELDIAEFQALLDAAAAESGLADVKVLIAELRAAMESRESYVDADDFLAQYDAAHGSS